jgi:hypothetical protein
MEQNAICNDANFIISCAIKAMDDEIQWPIVEEWVSLGTHIEFQGCIKLIYCTFIEVHKPCDLMMPIGHGSKSVNICIICITWWY